MFIDILSYEILFGILIYVPEIDLVSALFVSKQFYFCIMDIMTRRTSHLNTQVELFKFLCSTHHCASFVKKFYEWRSSPDLRKSYNAVDNLTCTLSDDQSAWIYERCGKMLYKRFDIIYNCDKPKTLNIMSKFKRLNQNLAANIKLYTDDVYDKFYNYKNDGYYYEFCKIIHNFNRDNLQKWLNDLEVFNPMIGEDSFYSCIAENRIIGKIFLRLFPDSVHLIPYLILPKLEHDIINYNPSLEQVQQILEKVPLLLSHIPLGLLPESCFQVLTPLTSRDYYLIMQLAILRGNIPLIKYLAENNIQDGVYVPYKMYKINNLIEVIDAVLKSTYTIYACYYYNIAFLNDDLDALNYLNNHGVPNHYFRVDKESYRSLEMVHIRQKTIDAFVKYSGGDYFNIGRCFYYQLPYLSFETLIYIYTHFSKVGREAFFDHSGFDQKTKCDIKNYNI